MFMCVAGLHVHMYKTFNQKELLFGTVQFWSMCVWVFMITADFPESYWQVVDIYT